MKRTALAAVVAIAALIGTGLAPVQAANAAPLTAADFLKASGNVLKTNSGTGATVNLRGTNIGGTLTQED